MNIELINKSLALWSLDSASVTLVAERENKVYKVDHGLQSYALRLHRPGLRSVSEINSELQWMDQLAANGVAVPRPVRSVDMAYTHTINEVTVSVLSWVDGTPLSKLTPTEQLYFELGVELSKMHAIADRWALPDTFDRLTWDLTGENPTWSRYWENPALSKKQKDYFLDFNDRAHESIQNMDALRSGLIHADLVPDNVLHNGTQLQLIDFDDGGFGYRLFDLATITHRSRRYSTGPKLVDAVVAGYRQSHDVDKTELMLFEALRACSYVGWNISRMHEPGGLQRNSRFIFEAETSVNAIYQSEF